MEKLSQLSSRSLEYYINASRWKNELDFFSIEVHFLNRLMEEHFLQLAGQDRLQKMIPLGNKLSSLMNEKYQVKDLLNRQLHDLELKAEGLLNELPEELVAKQANLQNRMMNLLRDYREVKMDLYALTEAILDDRKLLIN